MPDYLFSFFGGNEIYSKEEWKQLTSENYDLVEVDVELSKIATVIHEKSPYDVCYNSLFRTTIKDYDFEIQLRNSETKKVLVVKKFSHLTNDGKIRVNKI